jgi:hypothetical protein
VYISKADSATSEPALRIAGSVNSATVADVGIAAGTRLHFVEIQSRDSFSYMRKRGTPAKAEVTAIDPFASRADSRLL